jgi:hypothetical protein
MIDMEQVDQEALLRFLAATFQNAAPEGDVVGRTQLRDAVAARLGCSQLQAEELVDTLVLLGRLQLSRPPDAPPFWRIEVR